MSEKILDIKQITYSRELFDAKPAKFASALVYIFLSILLICLIWSYVNEIDIVARGEGIVRPSTHVNTVKVEHTGKLNELNVFEGKYVEQDEILYVLEHSTLALQQLQYSERIQELKDELDSLKLYEKSIMNSEDLFTNANTYNDYYQSKYMNYVQNMRFLEIQQQSNELNISKTNRVDILEEQLADLRSDLSHNLLLRQSIDNGTNLNKSSIYSKKYDEYSKRVEQYNNEISYQQANVERYTSLMNRGVISKSEFDKVKLDLDNLILTYDEYQLSYMTALNEKIKGIEESIANINSQMNLEALSGDILKSEELNYSIQIEKYTLDTLITIREQMIDKQNVLNDFEVQYNNILVKMNQAVIKAPTAGYINLIKEVSVGDYLTIGDEMLTIIPADDDYLTVDVALPNYEVSGVGIGDLVKIQFDALPFREYGEFQGTIVSISHDIKSDNLGNSFYLVEVKLTSHQGVSYKGETRDVKVGMSCKAYIIKEQKKVLYWLLEKINLREVD